MRPPNEAAPAYAAQRGGRRPHGADARGERHQKTSRTAPAQRTDAPETFQPIGVLVTRLLAKAGR